MDTWLPEQIRSLSKVAASAATEGMNIGKRDGLLRAISIVEHMRDEVNARVYDRIIARLREEV